LLAVAVILEASRWLTTFFRRLLLFVSILDLTLDLTYFFGIGDRCSGRRNRGQRDRCRGSGRNSGQRRQICARLRAPCISGITSIN
jgi:hypothetical protein